MDSTEDLAQTPRLGECPELPSEQQVEQQMQAQQTWPYDPVHLICCALPDQPFQVMREEQCTSLGHGKFEWPIWEGERGCVRPPSKQEEDPEVCCFLTDRTYLRSVVQTSYSECVISNNQVIQAVPLTWCEAPKCVPGLAADNYPDGFRKPDGEVWPSYGVDPRISFRNASKLFTYTGFAVLILVVLTCCFFVIVVVLRGIFGPRRQRQRGPVAHNRSEASFTTLDSVLADAELMPDINRRGAPVDTSLPDVPEEPEGGTTGVVVVVMPDSSMHLGRGEDVSPRAVGPPAVAAPLKTSPQDPADGSSAAAGAAAAAAAGAQSASESEPVHSRNASGSTDAGASSSGSGSGDSVVSNAASQARQPTGRAAQLHAASQRASVEAVETSAGERCGRSDSNSDAAQAAVELTCVQQQTRRGDGGVGEGTGAVDPGADADPEVAATAGTSSGFLGGYPGQTWCSLPVDGGDHGNLQDDTSSFHTGEGSAGPGTPVSQREQDIE